MIYEVGYLNRPPIRSHAMPFWMSGRAVQNGRDDNKPFLEK